MTPSLRTLLLSITHLYGFTSDHSQKDRALHSSHAAPAHEEEVRTKLAEETQM